MHYKQLIDFILLFYLEPWYGVILPAQNSCGIIMSSDSAHVIEGKC